MLGFYNYVGGAEAHVHYSISSRADLMLKGGLNADGTIPVTEIWRNFDKTMDPSVTSLESMVQTMGKDAVKRAFDNGNLTRTFLTTMEAAHLTKVANDIEHARYLAKRLIKDEMFYEHCSKTAIENYKKFNIYSWKNKINLL